MALVQSFEPIVGTNPKVLILGSMPGVASLEQQQYYAHPRNAFWPIMAELFGVEWNSDYDLRIQQLRTLPVILWDVLKSCHRDGSLDSSISKDELVANEIVPLLEQFPDLKMIIFNGSATEKMFKQYVAQSMMNMQTYEMVRLPSTSPAHASKNLQQKLKEWSVIRSYCN